MLRHAYHALLCSVVLSHVQSCPLILRHALSCSVMPRHAPSWPVMSSHAQSCSVMLRHAQPCSAMLRHALLCSVMSSHVQSCPVMLCHAPSCSVMLHHAASCCVMLRHAPSCSDMLRHAPTCCVILRHAPSCSVMLSHAPPPPVAMMMMMMWWQVGVRLQSLPGRRWITRVSRRHMIASECISRLVQASCTACHMCCAHKCSDSVPVAPHIRQTGLTHHTAHYGAVARFRCIGTPVALDGALQPLDSRTPWRDGGAADHCPSGVSVCLIVVFWKLSGAAGQGHFLTG